MVSSTDPSDRNLGFLDRSRHFFFQVAPQLYSQAWVDPFQTHYFSENVVAQGIAGTSGSVTRNPDHYTTEVYLYILIF
jgi:hypothetical protein